MSYIFQTIFYQPILNLLVFLYNVVPGHDLGLAIILLTVIIKVVLLPLSKQSIKSQKAVCQSKRRNGPGYAGNL